MKKGYSLLDIGQVNQGSYNFDIKRLIRDVKKEVAGILIIVKSDISKKTYYVCIPIENYELFQKYFSEINAWDESLTTAYCYVISGFYSQINSRAYELEKPKPRSRP
ncbi:MAG: hypothetical protein K2U26_19980 [Cyclobacteriaceae bacterium]|nr:hypothetical protein [Cyclobacteriaceae bacterium]